MSPQSIMSAAHIVKGISTALGIVGGLLGAYTFIDTYVLRFKPKFVIGDRIYLVYKKNKADYTYLSSLVIQFDIFNHRNKLGRVEDIFLKIYDSRMLEASVLDLFPIANLEEMPISREDVISVKRLPPAPFAVPNKSSKTIVLEMAQEKLHHGAISPSAYLNLEAFYKNPVGKWKKFAKLSLYAGFEESSTHGDATVHNFSLIDRFSERERLKRKRIRLKITSYKGIAGFYLSLWMHKSYRFVISKFAVLPKGIRYLLSMGVALWGNIISEYIEWPIARSKTSKKRPLNISIGNAIHAKQTILFLTKIGVSLERKVAKLNKHETPERKIVITAEAKEIVVKRGDVRIKIYIGGDGFIGIHKSIPNSEKVEMIFTIKIKQFPFRRFIWSLSEKPVFSSTVATRVLDYLALLTLR
ncbi:hypothetical protein WJ542_29355 [Paraburkholderia sp. B3]|uniref:hypothetical protein n=1 Tax=Paraburkholderia sp. B3 TaxID=3134791 RepID=UPI0039822D6A